MKKNKLQFFLIIQLFFFPFFLSAEQLDLHAGRTGSGVVLFVSHNEAVFRGFWETLESGLKAEILFTLQSCEKNEGVFGFLGEFILQEKTVRHVAYKNFFDDEYILEIDEKTELSFSSLEALFDAFNKVDDLKVDQMILRGDNRYLRAQARMFRVKLIVPLSMIYLFSQDGVFESPWVTL